MRAITLTALAALTLTGCGTSTTATPNTSPAAVKPAATTAAEPPVVGATQSRTSDDITVAATVYHVGSVKSHVNVAETGRRFVGIDVKVCAVKAASSLTLGQNAWTLTYADDTEAQPIGDWYDGEFTQPLYPVERKAVAGQCVRGWIMFKPLKGKPASVAYAAGEDDAPAFWRIP